VILKKLLRNQWFFRLTDKRYKPPRYLRFAGLGAVILLLVGFSATGWTTEWRLVEWIVTVGGVLYLLAGLAFLIWKTQREIRAYIRIRRSRRKKEKEESSFRLKLVASAKRRRF